MNIQWFSFSSHTLCFLFLVFFDVGAGGGDGSIVRIKMPGKSLRFAKSSTFKIALFADLHFGENAWTDWGPFQDTNSQAVMSAVLDREKPGTRQSFSSFFGFACGQLAAFSFRRTFPFPVNKRYLKLLPTFKFHVCR